jgi:hypothetical protein
VENDQKPKYSVLSLTVQLAKKERTHELNIKFDKTYNIFFKILSQFDIKRKSQFICMTYKLSNKSFH